MVIFRLELGVYGCIKNYRGLLKRGSKYGTGWMAVALVLLCGCRYGLPTDEIRDMTQVQQGWERIVVGEEEKFLAISQRHEAFMAALQDSSLPHVHDTLVRLQVSRLLSNYEGAKRRHIYNLKGMRSFLDATKVWLQRVNTESRARELARRSWQARTTTFKSLYGRIQATRDAFDQISPQYHHIAKLIPGLGALP